MDIHDSHDGGLWLEGKRCIIEHDFEQSRCNVWQSSTSHMSKRGYHGETMDGGVGSNSNSNKGCGGVNIRRR